ncbi:hypothetical protein [Sphingomonas sp. 22176]|uniref:hypothetical protein n=1 Tax=Sphingomonas sp. 22176 TaxID=3453884 RepID=UPI003F8743D3
MTATAARAMMRLAVHLLGDARRPWAQAMLAEFDIAAAEGRGLDFAAGCLGVACRLLPMQAEGRRGIATHLLALGLILPMAALLFCHAGDLSLAAIHVMIGPEAVPNPYLRSAQRAAVPGLLLLWLVLGGAHLGLAWAMVERNVRTIAAMGAVMLAATVTLATYTSILSIQDLQWVWQACAILAELGGLFAFVHWAPASAQFE